MLQAAIGGIILLLIYKFLERNNSNDLEPKIDWWMAILIFLGPQAC